jgi:hypothetical protein
MAASDIQEKLAEHGLTPEDYGVDLDLNACEGIAVGDFIQVIEDYEDEGIYIGDEGEVLAFYKRGVGMWNPTEHMRAVVKFDGMDPQGVPVEILEPQ